MMNLPKLIAHRGLSSVAPENTLAAMQAAQANDIKWVEFDVQLTADHDLVVFHDSDLDRTTNGSGPLDQFTLAELKQLDAGSWWSEDSAGLRIPSFEEVMLYLSSQGMSMNVELKPREGQEVLLAKQLLQALSRHWPEIQEEPILSSFNWQALYTLREQGSLHPLGLLMNEWRDDWLEHAIALKVKTVHLNQSLVTEQRANEIRSEGYQLLAYTVNDLHRAKQLWDMGVVSVFSDKAHELLVKLRKLGMVE